MTGSPSPTSIDNRGSWQIHYHKHRMQPYTIWGGKDVWYFAASREEALDWISRRGRLSVA